MCVDGKRAPCSLFCTTNCIFLGGGSSELIFVLPELYALLLTQTSKFISIEGPMKPMDQIFLLHAEMVVRSKEPSPCLLLELLTVVCSVISDAHI